MLPLKIARKERVARDICRFELVPLDDSPDGPLLPAFTAGAHVTVETPSGAMRRYSLCQDPAQRDRYVIAVKREAEGRGGSAAMHDDTREGQILPVSAPENEFALVAAPSYLLIAGGIGITPILSMARVLSREGKPFALIYCSRSAEEAAFLEELASDAVAGAVTLHHDGGDPERRYDFWDHVAEPSDAHVYCCGPKALMDEVRDMTGHWRPSAVHFEDFKPVEVVKPDDRPFSVTLARSGRVVAVPADRTILEALREAGIRAPSSCESGTCGSCKTGLVSGAVEHRDSVLMAEERPGQVMICVSRAASGDLVLDL